jgi:hypothetical protein
MGAGKGSLAPLLPFWEQGLGDEGKPAQRFTDFCVMDSLAIARYRFVRR